jgi:tetratricopeptide (TPR) repeat protein
MPSAFGIVATAALLALAGPGAEFRSAQARAHYQRAMRYADRGLWPPALLAFNQALRLEPENVALLVGSAAALGEMKQWDAALQRLRTAVRLAPGSAEAHYNLGVTLDRAQPGAGAGTTEYRKALALNPRHAGALVNLAANLGDHDPAEARRLLLKAIEINPKLAEAHLNLGLLLRKRSDPAGAEREFQAAVLLDPALLEARRQLAALFAARQDWAAAIRECRETLARDPKDWNVRYTLGQALVRAGNAEDGRQELEAARTTRAEQEKREIVERHLARGSTRLLEGETHAAAAEFQAAVEADPGSAAAHMHLGLALAAAADFDQALGELSRAVELDPSSAEARANLGTVLLQRGDETRASSELARALELNPYLPEAHNSLGLLLVHSAKPAEALEHFRTAADLKPGYAEALFNLALALRSLNRPAEAVSPLREAARAAPQNARIHYALGMALQQSGDSRGAKEALERASALQSRRR